MNYALSVATTSQKIQGMGIATKLINDYGGPAKANQTLAKVVPPIKKKIKSIVYKSRFFKIKFTT